MWGCSGKLPWFLTVLQCTLAYSIVIAILGTDFDLSPCCWCNIIPGGVISPKHSCQKPATQRLLPTPMPVAQLFTSKFIFLLLCLCNVVKPVVLSSPSRINLSWVLITRAPGSLFLPALFPPFQTSISHLTERGEEEEQVTLNLRVYCVLECLFQGRGNIRPSQGLNKVLQAVVQWQIQKCRVPL